MKTILEFLQKKKITAKTSSSDDNIKCPLTDDIYKNDLVGIRWTVTGGVTGRVIGMAANDFTLSTDADLVDIYFSLNGQNIITVSSEYVKNAKDVANQLKDLAKSFGLYIKEISVTKHPIIGVSKSVSSPYKCPDKELDFLTDGAELIKKYIKK